MRSSSEANRIGVLVCKKLFEIMDLQADIDALIRDKHPSPFGSGPFKNCRPESLQRVVAMTAIQFILLEPASLVSGNEEVHAVGKKLIDLIIGQLKKFLAFHSSYADFAGKLARAVADHATPVGSGTVARTKRIPVEQRAEAAVIAWMRHQTTAYDARVIPRVKGKRREVRRMPAQRSKELLGRYRRGEAVGEDCPLTTMS
jgi:hypothetical protein